ncbi:hypothetical protein FOXYS1_10233 [Fusarium oxysporum]|uniref:Carboxylesterase type B domain-containing protein n=1 Tax=Fusarium oxysporum TaxID=5507 RepID=A0A8H5A5H6_FUSOX|nr:hypothetical protein FOXYS1_10233 [Fusarium oxysporum]
MWLRRQTLPGTPNFPSSSTFKALEWVQKYTSRSGGNPKHHANQDYRRNHSRQYPGGTRLPICMWGPVIDGDFVQDALRNSFVQGKFVKVPSIIGATTNEGRAFAPAASSQTEVEDFFQGRVSAP